ncbi:MAG: VIT domain-containing protein [Myxococcota bacterium]
MKLNLMPVAVLAVLTTAPSVLAQQRPDVVDKTGAPYFIIDAERGDVETLPLESTASDVQVAGTIAHVRQTQVYRNRGSEVLEATYVFPGSTKAAVFAMRMKVGERTIEAQIQTKAKARETYNQAKKEGRSASLLEQHRPNVFQMSVANILPGDRIEVQLDYVEMLVPDKGTYELVIPAVVGPRYAGDQGAEAAAPTESWIQNPYLSTKGKGSPYKWSAKVNIAAGMPVAALTSPSHKVSPRFDGPTTAGLQASEGGDRDFVVRYRLSGQKIQSGVLLYPGEGDEENFFAMMMTPPERPSPRNTPPREYMFIIDVSGSMRGFPLNVSKDLIRKLLKDLRPVDRFNILLFAGASQTFSDESLPATNANIQRAMQMIDRQRGGGGTRLLPALKRALAMPRSDDMSTSMVIVSDGYIGVEREAFELVRKNLGEANLFAFGIGRSVNRHLIEGLARAGMGAPFVVLDNGAAPATAEKFHRYIEAPVLTNIGVHFDGFQAYDVEPATVPDLFGERPVMLFGKYKGSPKGRIVVEGTNAAGAFRRTLDVGKGRADRRLIALKYLWARHRIADLSDFANLARDASIKEEVTALGLRYSLMTAFTSFVAVDPEIRNANGKIKTVKQPLPLPDGMAESKLAPMQSMHSPSLGSVASGSGGGGLALRSTRYAGAKLPKPVRRRRARSSGDLKERLGAGKPSQVRTMARQDPAAPPASAEPEAEAAAEDQDAVASAKPDAKPKAEESAEVAKTMKRYRSSIQKCYDRYGAGAKGRLNLRVSIGADGKPTGVDIVSSSGRRPLDKCIRNIFRKSTWSATGQSRQLIVPFIAGRLDK